MSKYYVLYNPLAGNNTGRDETVKLVNEPSLQEHELIFTDMTTIKSYDEFFSALTCEDRIILSGGDGTINRFVNDTSHINITNDMKVVYNQCFDSFCERNDVCFCSAKFDDSIENAIVIFFFVKVVSVNVDKFVNDITTIVRQNFANFAAAVF